MIGTDIARVAELLSRGEVVAIPTETVYGLAADALDADAVAKIFEAKRRPFFDPLIVHLSSTDTIELYVHSVPNWAIKLFDAFSPGPITIVLQKKEIIPDIVTAGLDSVGIRIPRHPMTQELLAMLDFPLAAPSANPFGYISPTSAAHVSEQLGDVVPYILDGGESEVGVESTIITERDNRPVILRLGGISVEEIELVIGSVGIHTYSSQPLSPGMLESHYAPKKKFVLGKPLADSERVGYLRFEKYISSVSRERQKILSSSGDVREAARNVFRAMRELDALDLDMIYSESVPDIGLGRAINDRLKRAAAVGDQ